LAVSPHLKIEEAELDSYACLRRQLQAVLSLMLALEVVVWEFPHDLRSSFRLFQEYS
jgi:hypothetical protein